MRGLFEFIKRDIIANQMIIAETFEKVKNMICTFEECLNLESADYVKKSTEALRSLWFLFEDNNILLSEADLKEDSYYTQDIYKKVKEEFLFVMAILPDLQRTSNREGSVPSPRDAIITQQRKYFKDLHDLIKSTDIDDIRIQWQMEDCQHRLHNQWNPIEDGHWEIRQFFTLLPDVTYELEFMRYKNMYETTLSLLNYKIDSVCHPVYRIIPQIGIPTWRMFDENAEISAFAVKSIVWERLGGLREMIRNNKISEGDKRQLLVRAFLTYQKSVCPSESRAPDSMEPRFNDVPGEPIVCLPITEEVD